MYLFVSNSILLVLGLFLPLIISRNQTLRFAEIADITGKSSSLGNSFQLGIYDAFNESNNMHELDGITLVQLLADGGGNASIAEEAMTNFINDIDNIFAFIGPTTLRTTRLVANYTVPNKIPLIGPLAGATEFRKPFNPYIINLRPSTDEESYAMINYIVTRLFFTRIAIFYCSDEYGMSGINALRQAMYLFAVTPYMMGIYDGDNLSNITAAIQARHLLPQIIIVRHYTEEVTNLILYIKQMYPFMKFFIFSSTSLRNVVGVIYTNGGYDKRYIDGIYTPVAARNLPSDPKYKTGLNYRKPPAPILSFTFSTIAPHIKLEGFLVGRLIIDTLQRLPKDINVTRESFLQMIYDSGGYDLGPFAKCGGLFWPSEGKGADREGCNQCGRLLRIFYSDMATMTIPEDMEGAAKFSTCGFQMGKREFLFLGMTKPMNGPYVYQAHQIDAGIRAALHEINLLRGLRGTKVIYESLDHHSYDEGQSNIDYLLNTLNVQSLIGLSDREFIKYGLNQTGSLFAGMSASTLFRDPFNYHYLNFLPNDRHQYVILVEYLVKTYGQMRIGLWTSQSVFGDATRQSLKDALTTKRIDLYIDGKYNISTSEIEKPLSDMRKQAQHGDPQAIVVDGSPDIVGKFIFQAKRIWKHCLFIISSDGGTEDAIQAYTSASTTNATDYNRIYTLQSLPHPLNTSMSIVIEYQKALLALDEDLTPSFFSLYGYLVGKMTAFLLNNDPQRNMHRIEFYYQTYQQQKFQLMNFPCGPFAASNNLTTGCSSCSQTTYLYPILPTGVISSIPVYHRDHSICMPTLNTNVDFTTYAHYLFIIFSVLLSIFACVVIALLVKYRQHFLILPNFKFSLLSCLGCIFSFMNLALQYGVPTNANCIGQVTLSNIAFVFVFGPIFAKTSRLHQIFNNKRLRKLRISDRSVLGRFLLIFIYFLIYNIAWLIIDRPKIQEAWTETGVRYENCTSHTAIFMTINVLSHFAYYIYGAFLCFRIQGIKGEWAMFNESKEIGTSIYVGTFLNLLQFVLQCILKNGYEHAISGAIFDALTSFTVLWILTIPPIFKAYHNITREEFIAKYKTTDEIQISSTIQVLGSSTSNISRVSNLETLSRNKSRMTLRSTVSRGRSRKE